MDPLLLDNVSSPDHIFEFVCHVGCYLNMHSIIFSGLIAGGKNCGRDRQTVSFTAVDRMDGTWTDRGEHDLTKPGHAAYTQR